VLYIILGQLFAQIILSGALFPLENNPASKLVISHWTMDAMGATVNVNRLNEESRVCKVVDEVDAAYTFFCDSAEAPAEKLGLSYEHSAEHLLTAWAALLIQALGWGALTMIVQARRKLT